MADRPEGAFHATDDNLDELVAEIESEDELLTPDPDDEPAAPARTTPVADKPPQERPAASLGAGEDDEDDDDGQPAAPVASAPAAPAPAPPVGAKPFQFKSRGADHALPGALELPDGNVLIPKTARDEFARRLASQVELESNFRTMQRENTRERARLAKERTDKDIESDAIIKEWQHVASLSPDEQWEYFENFRTRQPEFNLAVEKQKLEQREKALLERQNPTKLPEELAEERQTELATEFANTRARFMAVPEVQALPEAIRNRIFAKYENRLDRLIVKDKVVRDGKEVEVDVFDDTEVAQDLELAVELRKSAAPAAPKDPPAPRESDAAARNRVRNADMNVIPPTVRERRPRADGQPRDNAGRFKGDRRAFKDAFMKGDLDAPD